MTIREAQIEDLQQLAPLFNAYRVFYKQPSDIKGAKDFLTCRFKEKDSQILVAITNSELVGFTQIYPMFSSVSMQRSYVLNDLYVNDLHRHKKIGEGLLKAAQQFCKTNNAKGLTLETDTHNPAQKLYERLKWKRDTDVFHYTWTNKT